MVLPDDCFEDAKMPFDIAFPVQYTGYLSRRYPDLPYFELRSPLFAEVLEDRSLYFELLGRKIKEYV
jgi:hypothetical protein